MLVICQKCKLRGSNVCNLNLNTSQALLPATASILKSLKVAETKQADYATASNRITIRISYLLYIGPTLKVRRHVVHMKCAATIEDMYQSDKSELTITKG